MNSWRSKLFALILALVAISAFAGSASAAGHHRRHHHHHGHHHPHS